MNVADFIITRLLQWGVHRIYGYPGDAINPLTGALAKHAEQMAFTEARHEEMAAFMATAHAKFTGDLGVVMATSGPGAIHLLNGLYDAKLDNQPVLAIVGQQDQRALGSDFMQEVDLKSLFKDVASEFVHVLSKPSQARHLIDRAVRIAIAERTVTCIIVPVDVQQEKAEPEPPQVHGQSVSGVGYMVPRVVPQVSELRRAAEILNEGNRVAMLIGAGCIGGTDEVIAVADRLQAGVAKALLGKSVLPDDLPYVTGSIGLLGTNPSWDMMRNCDTLLMVGSNFPYSEFLPKVGQARGIQIDIRPRNISLRYPMEVNLVGDARETLLELLPLLRQKENTGWRNQITQWTREWWQVVEARALERDGNMLNPQSFFWQINNTLPENAIIMSDCGTSTVWVARDIQVKRGMMVSTSGGLATMGCGLPYAIGAKFAWPDRPVFAFVGDGAMQMNGNSELVTVAKYWRQWRTPTMVIVVLNNRDLSFVTWEQRGMQGMPKVEMTQQLPDVQYAEYARTLGLNGIRVESESQIASAWEAAISSDRPTVIDLVCNPNIPPLPPHVTKEQAMSFAKSWVADPERGDMFFESIKQMADSIFPGYRSH